MYALLYVDAWNRVWDEAVGGGHHVAHAADLKAALDLLDLWARMARVYFNKPGLLVVVDDRGRRVYDPRLSCRVA